MDFWYEIYPEHRAAFVRLSGSVIGQELAAAIEAFFRDPDWQPGFALLWDSRAVTGVSVKRHEVQEIVGVLTNVRDRVQDSLLATIVTNDTFQHVGQLLLLLSGWNDRAKIFSRFDRAVEWLGIDLALAAAIKQEFERQDRPK